jgi:hypothetical protein
MSARLPRFSFRLAPPGARRAAAAQATARIATMLVALFALVVAAALAPMAAG